MSIRGVKVSQSIINIYITLFIAIISVIVLSHSFSNLGEYKTLAPPSSIEQVDQPIEVLRYLQDYNRAIVEIGSTLYWLLTFMFILTLQIIIPYLVVLIFEQKKKKE
jgi:hypothetical protein